MTWELTVLATDPPAAVKSVMHPPPAGLSAGEVAEMRGEVVAHCLREYGPGTLSGDFGCGFTFRPGPVEVMQ